MAENTIIVELVGLPGCGKSTLANNLKSVFEQDGRKTGVWTDMTSDFKNLSFMRKLKCLSLKKLFQYIGLVGTCQYAFSLKRYMIQYFVKIDILYRYVRKFGSYDYVLVDHGFFQQALSAQYGSKLPDNQKFISRFRKIMKTEIQNDYIIECMIDAQQAQQRMKQRNRVNEGRLDKEKDEAALAKMFMTEKENFECIVSLMSELASEDMIIQLDMEKAPEELTKAAKQILCGDVL